MIVQVFEENTVVNTFEKLSDSTWVQCYDNVRIHYTSTKINNNEYNLYDTEKKILVHLTLDPCTLYMHIDAGKRVKMFPNCTLKCIQDDNEEIMKLLQDRLVLGRSRYGHGIRVDDDTRQWGTEDNSWETMMMEEALDGMIYAAASILRIRRKRASVSSGN